jgi:hypothetical protein
MSLRPPTVSVTITMPAQVYREMPRDLLNESHSACRRALTASRGVSAALLRVLPSVLINPSSVVGRGTETCGWRSHEATFKSLRRLAMSAVAFPSRAGRVALRLPMALAVLAAVRLLPELCTELPDFNLAVSSVREGADDAPAHGFSTSDVFSVRNQPVGEVARRAGGLLLRAVSVLVRRPRMESNVEVAESKGAWAVVDGK